MIFIQLENNQIGLMILTVDGKPVNEHMIITQSMSFGQKIVAIDKKSKTYVLDNETIPLSGRLIKEYKRFKEYLRVYQLGKDKTLLSIAEEFIKENYSIIKDKCKDWGWNQATTLEGALESMSDYDLLSWVVAECMSWSEFNSPIDKYKLKTMNRFTLLIGGEKYQWDITSHNLKKIL